MPDAPAPTTETQPTAPAPTPAPTKPTNDRGYPSDTPIAEMTEKQQAAYWKDKARKHEERAKAFDGLTPETLAELRDKADKHAALERELMSDKDKAVAEAKDATKAEVAATYQPRLVRAEFKAAAAGRIDAEKLDSILEPLDLSKFLTSKGDVDEGKVASYVDGIAPAGPVRRTGPTATGLGHRVTSGSGPGDQGRAMAAKRFGTTTN